MLEDFDLPAHAVHDRSNAAQRIDFAGKQIDDAKSCAARLISPRKDGSENAKHRSEKGQKAGQSRKINMKGTPITMGDRCVYDGQQNPGTEDHDYGNECKCDDQSKVCHMLRYK